MNRFFMIFASAIPISIRHTVRGIICAITLDKTVSNLKILEKNCESLKDYYNLIQKIGNPLLPFYKCLSSAQKEYEVLRLISKASELGLSFVAEIGTYLGGTTYLLCKVAREDATIITLDIDMPQWRRRLLKTYASMGQNLIAMKADSRRKDTVRMMAGFLNQHKLDFLFIDGDHSYRGVKQDFINYSPFVRKGGWIAFHDIIPDYRTRYGVRTSSYAGDVPEFWKEIKRQFKHFEIVEDRRQDGFGIGVIIWE